MHELNPHLLLAFSQDSDEELKSATLEEVPINGQLEKPIAPADQNLFLLLVFPLALLVVGAILYLLKRSSADASSNGGAKGGLWLMLAGFVLSALAFIYIMIA
ncbi:MAG: hypothetical protein MK085_08840 [Phycisphaerales bacterium]|nr:hypothetical protein [Phycisphaerales bacterium]